MHFYVQSPWAKEAHPGSQTRFPCVIIRYSDWDDYGYRTSAHAAFFESAEKQVYLGSFRIMARSQTSHWDTNTSPVWVFQHGPFEFASLARRKEEYCSIGTDIFYYQNISRLGRRIARQILMGLCDAVFSENIWKSFSSTSCFKVSLMRSGSEMIRVRDEAREVLSLDARLTNTFSFTTKLPRALNAHDVMFDFSREEYYHSYINLLAGVNGCGKTQLMARLAIALTGVTSGSGQAASEAEKKEELDKRLDSGDIHPPPSYYSVIAVSFNPFDNFERPPCKPSGDVRYTYCGIRNEAGGIYSQSELVDRLREAANSMDEDQRARMTEATQRVLGMNNYQMFFSKDRTEDYSTLSAGQKVVLNILAHLINHLEQRTLVLIDEPETHLHPSLMSSFMTELLLLLKNTDSSAIVATHSPIIAQQVPSKFIHRIVRTEDNAFFVEHPDIRCFGGSLSEITNALFDTREYERDYTDVVDDLLKKHNGNVIAAEAEIPGGFGSVARAYAIARAGQHYAPGSDQDA